MKAAPMTVYLPDQRNVTISRYGYGNSKVGLGVFTYSRPAGGNHHWNTTGTCPGSTDECESICYAKRIDGPVKDVYLQNIGPDVPPIPVPCKLLRIHVSGDFDTNDYINNWRERLIQRPDVTAWAYTRSWRVPGLVDSLQLLAALPNIQLFASMDPSCQELPPVWMRRAWIWRDRQTKWPTENRLMFKTGSEDNMLVIADGTPSYVCPEETGRKSDCVNCGYCFEGKKHDVTFLEH